MAIKLTMKQTIEKAHIYMMRRPALVWLAPTMMIGSVTIDPNCPTAATNGRDVVYGEKFLSTLTFKQVLATVIHENLHKQLMHLITYRYLHEKYDAQYPGAVNMAMDFVINRIIKKLADDPDPEVEMWTGIKYCYDPKYDDEMKWDTPTILKDLIDNAGGGGGGGGSGQGKGKGSIQASHDAHDWARAKELDAGELDQLEKDIESAIHQGQSLSKHLKGTMPRSVGALLTPAVDPKKALRDFLTERVRNGSLQTWSRFNRRFLGQGRYRPSSYDEAIKSLGFFVDMSGSVGPEEVREVLTELDNFIKVMRPEAVDIIYWNTEVARHEHYAGADVGTCINSTKPTGTGGTAPSCVIPFCKSRNINPAAVVWLSDGYVGGDWAEGLGVPSFWVITSNGAVPNHLPHAKLPVRM